MTEYIVTWQMDIEAESPLEAAKEALRIHRDPASIATIFTVQEKDRSDGPITIDVDTTEEIE